MLRRSYASEASLGEDADPVAQIFALGHAVRRENYATLIPRHTPDRSRYEILRRRIHPAVERGRIEKRERRSE